MTAKNWRGSSDWRRPICVRWLTAHFASTAIERWGEDAPAHLFGAFTFACWNERDRRLLLCRDPMGERCLYFHSGANFIAFATTIGALHALPNVPRALDETVVGDRLANNPFEARRTVYRGIERVHAGEIVLCAGGDVTIRRYWQPQRRTLGLKSHDDCVEAAREQLDRAVARTLRSAQPVAISASGGLNSSGVAATAARLLAPGRLAVYTRVPPPGFNPPETVRTYYSERSKVAALAGMHPNMDVSFVDDAGLHAFDSEPFRAISAMRFPIGTPHNLGWFAQLDDRVAANGHHVLLTGQPGNLSLGWLGQNLLDQLVARGSWLQAAREVFARRRVTGRSVVATVRTSILSPRWPAALRWVRRRWQGVGEGNEHNTFLSPAFAREHRLVERIRDIGGWSDKVMGRDPFEARAYWLINARAQGRDLRGQMLATRGIEVREPLGDARLVEFCLNVPEEHYLRDGRPRALQRDVIADRVPPEIYNNYKFGEQVPEWFDRLSARRDGLLADIERIARSPLASHAIDVDGLRRAAQNWPADAQAANTAGPKFRYGVARAVAVGNFICWFEGGNR